MSLLSHYHSKRSSSLSLFSPQTSPIRHLFKRTQSIRYAQLKPLDDLDSSDTSEKDKDETNQNPDNKETDKEGSKDSKKKDTEQEPICDLDDPAPGMNANTKKVHSNIELPSLPQLPSTPGTSNYTTLLEKKLNLIMTELDFSDPQGDVAAKEIRLNALNEILASVSNNNCDKLTNEDQDILYTGIKKILFKELSPIMPQFQFCDDLVTLLDGAWEQTKIGYQILTTYIMWSLSNPSKSTVKLAQGKDLKDLLKLIFRQFNKFDINERTQLIDILVQMISKDPKNITPEVLQKACHMISSYLDHSVQPYVLMPTVAILNYIFKFGTPLEKLATTGGKDPNHKESTASMTNLPAAGANNQGNGVSEANVEKYKDVYLQYVLPLLGAIHFPTCSDNMVSIIDQFVKGSPNLVMPTIMELVRHFPITRSVKTITFLKMLTVAMTKMNVRDFKKYMKLLFHLFVKCTIGPQVKVSDASLGVWHKIELEPLIMDNAKILFPFVYPMLSKGMRENWSQDIISNIDDIFQTMNRIDSFIFQDLCRQKQPQQASNMSGNDHLKTWAVIARMAAKHDKSMNLATKLAEIQRVFAVQQVQQTTQLNQPKNRSSTNLANSGQMMNMSRTTTRSGSSLPKNNPLPPFKGP